MTSKSERAAAAAAWMLAQLEAGGGELLQADAVHGLEEAFGDDCVYDNDHGNPAIARVVLQAFKELSQNRVVWSKAGRYWRLREPTDDAGRGQG